MLGFYASLCTPSTDATLSRRACAVGIVVLPRKEVIHAQLPLRMPCYDLAPIIEPTLFPPEADFRVFSTLLA